MKCSSELLPNRGRSADLIDEGSRLNDHSHTGLDARYDHHYTPEEILGYIYAVLHAPAYRRRYAEFLRIDFPRIPFPESKADFGCLSKFFSLLVFIEFGFAVIFCTNAPLSCFSLFILSLY